MGLLLKVVSVLIGIFMILIVINAMKRRKMSEVQSVSWLIGSVGIVIIGLFPEVLTFFADLLGIWWAPAVLIFFLLVLILFIVFNHASEISVLRSEVTELSMQISLMKYEKEEEKNENTDMQQN